jgi:LemA protein
MGLIVFLVVLAAAALYAAATYNGLVQKRNWYKNAFSQIDVQLKRRHDLVPNLVETARGYLAHERETLEAVVAARGAAAVAAQRAAQAPGEPAAMGALASAEQQLTGALGRVYAVMESYPALKADQTMKQVMEELASTENKIAFSRQAFNDAVTAYNVARESFPGNMFAGSFGFGPAELWIIEKAAEREVPKVSFARS